MNGSNQPEDEGNEIDLGEQNEPAATTAQHEQSLPPSYPSVMLQGGPALQRIADHGVHKIHARVISRHMPSRHNKHHRVELEIHKIKPQMKRGRPGASKHEEDSENIKKKMEEVPE